MTNAANTNLASDLAAARKGTFTGIIIQKEGQEKGGVRYGDDLVHAVIITGFSYLSLVSRSKEILETLTDEDIDGMVGRGYNAWSGRGAKAVAVKVARTDFDDARQELLESYARTLAGTNTSTTDEVYEPLVVNGEEVRGCRVYTGTVAAPVGTIYLQGLQIGSRVITPAANGSAPKPQSAPKTIAKNVLAGRLPISRYVSYKLAAGGNWILNIGGAAAVAADKNGITLDQTQVTEIKLALAC